MRWEIAIGFGFGFGFVFVVACPVEFALDSFSLSRSLSVSVYGIIELRGLMAAASLIWLSPLPHATCPKLTQAALANVKVLCKVFCVVLIARSLRQLVVVVGVLLLLLLLMLLLLPLLLLL